MLELAWNVPRCKELVVLWTDPHCLRTCVDNLSKKLSATELSSQTCVKITRTFAENWLEDMACRPDKAYMHHEQVLSVPYQMVYVDRCEGLSSTRHPYHKQTKSSPACKAQ